MSKNNFKLSLNKQVVSKLNQKNIVGGNQDLNDDLRLSISEDPDCPYSDWICFKTHDCYSHDYQCPWSGPHTQ